MQLINLKVTKELQTIRDISFKDGINIITNLGNDGNQVGKSTTLRAINFCLGSDGESLWKDPDNGNVNQDIKNLLLSGTVKFFLRLKVNNKDYLIKRSFFLDHQKTRIVIKRVGSINDENYNSQNKFNLAIAEVFSYTREKPTFNSVKSKFLRIRKAKVNSDYKFLHVFTSDDEYRLIYSYLFEFKSIEKIQEEVELKKEIDLYELRKKALLNGKAELYFRENLQEIDEEIKNLQVNEENYDISGIQDDVISQLRESRSNVASLSSQISEIETKVLYYDRTLNFYESKISTVDLSVIESIYEEAKIIFPEMRRSFEETLNFHNEIYLNKIQYLSHQIGILNQELVFQKDKLHSVIANETELVQQLASEGHFSGFILIEKAIQSKKEERGRVLYVIDEVSDINQLCSDLALRIIRLRNDIKNESKLFKKRLADFNTCYSSITKKLFKTYSNKLNAYVNDDNQLVFSIFNSEKNTGDGVPRIASMAFDMSLVDYMNKSKSKFIKFTLQDYLEAADEEKLTTLFKLANTENIQTVVSILNDKLSLLDITFKKDNVILELSSNDKFFKL